MDGCHSVCDRNYPAVRTDVTDAVTYKRIAFTYSTAQKKLKYLQCCTLVVRSRYDVGALLICFEYAPLLRVWFIAARSYLLAVFFACARSGAAIRAYLFHTCQLLRVIVVIFSADHLCRSSLRENVSAAPDSLRVKNQEFQDEPEERSVRAQSIRVSAHCTVPELDRTGPHPRIGYASNLV